MTKRDVGHGVTAAVAALGAMAATAAAGVLLLDAGRFGGFGRVTAAMVAVAVGGSAEFGAVPAGGTPVAVSGSVDVMPLGVALAGAVALGWLLLRHRDGLLVRGAAAAVAFPAGAMAVAMAARGEVIPPGAAAAGGISGVCGLPAIGPLGRGRSVDALSVGVSVPVWPVLAGAVVGVLAVVGVCRLVVRFQIAAHRALWTVGGLVAACLLVAWALGGPAVAGGVLLLLPHIVFGVLSLGLGVPWTVSSEGALACVLDGVAPPSPGGPLTWVAAALLLVLGALTVRGGRPLHRAAWLGAVVGVVLGGLALLSRVSVRLGIGAFGFSVPVLDAGVAANPLAALALGGAGAAAAGLLAGGLLRLASVSWPAWRDRAR
ncbi:hypothetical protein [Lentzea flaviverrucosa]|uniref:hypothetical protein n=1 Tax=Lentzea flaviverrucosa TaxID=200379 RepID=UPI001FEB5104|nr:hypothetical protein [Lentzea flaviverrucosa]